MPHDKKIGILGAGKLGVVLAQLARRAGYDVYIAGSGDPQKIALSIEVLAPGTHVATSRDAVRQADIVILAFPLSKYQQIPRRELAGKLVIDATNHWWEVDGPRDEFLNPKESSSQAVQAFLADARVVKALNHMGYHDLYDETKPHDAPNRKAIALAGDVTADVARVAQLIDTLGFDPVPIGALSAGRILEPGGPVFGASVDAQTLRQLLGVSS